MRGVRPATRAGSRGAAGACLAALALVVAACGAGTTTPEETAPPPTPLPSLRGLTASALPTESPDPEARLTADPESAYQQLLASVPFALASRCDRGDPTGGAIARVTCSPASGADRVTYLLFDAEDQLHAAYAARLDRIAPVDREGPGCASGPGSQKLKSGRRTCYRDGGDAAVVWTNDLVYILADARRNDADWKALDAFWAEAGPITP
jgi:hypothetical protein